MLRRAIVFGVLLFPVALHAQSWPTRPMTMVVPFAAGGPMDTVGRILAPRLGELLGQQVVIENVGGAGGMTGSARVAKATPDGYQFVLGNVGTHAVSQTLSKNPLYNAVTDFTPVALVADLSLVLVARKDLPASSLAEFIAYVRANQEKLQFASAGAGSATHLGCVLINAAIGVNVTHVPYRGGAPAMQDLVAGRIDYMCIDTPVAVPQIESGTIKGIAILARDALAEPAGARFRARAGARRFRGFQLGRRLPAQGHAGADRREAARCHRRDREYAGRAEAAEGQRRRSGRARRAGRRTTSRPSSRARSPNGPARSRPAA